VPPAPRPVRVVLADDEQIFVATLRLLLDRDERVLVVGTAANGAEAVEIAHRESADVVLLDLRMPVVDGYTATRLLRSLERPPQVIVLSGVDEDEAVGPALAAGAATFLLKGNVQDEVVDEIVRVADAAQ
jgi:DNA-binding NarL/FixJ family response regulator